MSLGTPTQGRHLDRKPFYQLSHPQGPAGFGGYQSCVAGLRSLQEPFLGARPTALVPTIIGTSFSWQSLTLTPGMPFEFLALGSPPKVLFWAYNYAVGPELPEDSTQAPEVPFTHWLPLSPGTQ